MRTVTVLATFLASLVAAPAATQACRKVTVKQVGFSVCLPQHWYVELRENGHVFACTEKAGKCVTGIGSYPLMGHATLEFAVKPNVVEAPAGQVASLDRWIDHTLRGPGVLSRRQLPTPPDWPEPAAIVEVKEIQQFASDPTVGTWVYHYFLRIKDRFLLVGLSFNLCEPRAKEYLADTRDIVRSIALLP